MKLPVGPIELLIIQGSPFCNINCSYCYLPDRNNTNKISISTVKKAIQSVVSEKLVNKKFSVVWHAGEPMAIQLSFYKEITSFIKEICNSEVEIVQHIQTNATLITQEWCDFFIENEFKIGVSIDGPEHIHDKYRHTKKGTGSFQKVMKGIDLLKKNKLPFTVISVLTDYALDYPEEMYTFFKDLGCTTVGFNIDEEDGANPTSTVSLKHETKLRLFWDQMFRQQLKDSEPLRIREIFSFNEMLLNRDFEDDKKFLGQMLTPLKIISIDTEGNFTTFSPELLGMKNQEYDDFILGNIHRDSYRESLQKSLFQKMFQEILIGVKMCNETCEYFQLCGGGAPSNKFYENGTFASTETNYCKYSRKVIIDSILENTEKHLGL